MDAPSEASEDSRAESQITDDGDDEPAGGISLGETSDEDDDYDESYDGSDGSDEESEDDSSVEYESEPDELDRCEEELEQRGAAKRAKRE